MNWSTMLASQLLVERQNERGGDALNLNPSDSRMTPTDIGDLPLSVPTTYTTTSPTKQRPAFLRSSHCSPVEKILEFRRRSGRQARCLLTPEGRGYCAGGGGAVQAGAGWLVGRGGG